MASLIHLIYSSAATKHFEDEDLLAMLIHSRLKNEQHDITGILLYENGSFFQVLEGPPDAVDHLYTRISQDDRHTNTVIIIREPIAKRSFGDWTMGFAKIDSQELDAIIGLNDFFTNGLSFSQMNSGRAKKLLLAFREGRWRSKVKHNSSPTGNCQLSSQSAHINIAYTPKISFAFQPIIDINMASVTAYEALIRGQSNEDFSDILSKISEQEWTQFDATCRAIAISKAAKLGLTCDLNLNFMARHVDDARTAIGATLDAAEQNDIEPGRIILEIDQDKLIGDQKRFAQIIEEYRGAGLQISIDHFGAGRAGLTLLELLRPEKISLNAQLVHGIDMNGSRQAIVRGVLQTCNDLGIDLIAKHVETYEEYHWLCDEGITLIQGDLIGRAAFEQLSPVKLPLVHNRFY